MHITQRNIILKLMYADKLRYSEIKPKSMNGNQFKYHLDALVVRGLVEKKDPLYRLTAEGKVYVEQVSQKTGLRTTPPRIIGQVIIKDDQGRYLLHRQERQPFPQTWNMPYAKVRFEQSPLATAYRIANGRFDIEDPKFNYCFSAYIFHRHKGVPVSGRVTFVFELIGTHSDLPAHKGNSAYFAPDNLPEELTPGTKQLLENYEKAPANREMYLDLDC